LFEIGCLTDYRLRDKKVGHLMRFRAPLQPIESLFIGGFSAVIAVSIRRMRDINRVGWWILLPLVSLCVLLSKKGIQNLTNMGKSYYSRHC
jgi:hypothetical protein